MKTYTKTHSSKKVAEIHLDKIEKRGGKASMKPVKGGFLIEYSFPEKKSQSKKQKRYDVLSPDGKTIRNNVPPFESLKARSEYFDNWKMQFARRGYWSPKKGLIPLSNLKENCKWIEV